MGCDDSRFKRVARQCPGAAKRWRDAGSDCKLLFFTSGVDLLKQLLVAFKKPLGAADLEVEPKAAPVTRVSCFVLVQGVYRHCRRELIGPAAELLECCEALLGWSYRVQRRKEER